MTPRIVTGGRSATIDPLKHSQPLGAALAFLGLARCMPIMHGSQGCASFAKALLTRHFNEPIPLQTTAVTEVSAVLGAGDSLLAALDAIAAKQRPDVIGVCTTGLTEVNGEDVAGELRRHLDERGDGGPLLVVASTPDFQGGLTDGWEAALRALMLATPLDGPRGVEVRRDDPAPGPSGPLVAMLVGPSLSAVDLDEMAGLGRAFGLDVILAPDLSGSLDGHLAAAWSPITTGGTAVADLRRLGSAASVQAVGATAAVAAHALSARSGAPTSLHPHLSGLGVTDALVRELQELSGRPAPAEVRRWRARLVDGLLDTHFVLGGARVALALEPEQLVAMSSLLHDVGAEVVAAVSPTDHPQLAAACCDEIVIGDLEDLRERGTDGGAELVLASSHARGAAQQMGATHLEIGFPVFDRLGTALRSSAGYRGSLQLLVDAANRLLDHRAAHDHPCPTGTRLGAHRAAPQPIAQPNELLEDLAC